MMIILLYFTVIKNKLIILYNRYITASFTRRIKLTICKSCDCRWSSWENGGKVYHYFIVWAVSVYPSFAIFFEISQKFSLRVRSGMNFIFVLLLLTIPLFINLQWFSDDGVKRLVVGQTRCASCIDECDTKCTALFRIFLWCSCYSHTRYKTAAASELYLTVNLWQILAPYQENAWKLIAYANSFFI